MKFNRLLLLVILILLCGVGLRLALYNIHGLEGDDGVALVLTRYDVPTLVEGLRRQELDVHPPLYFLLLKAWIAVAGESLLALRFFNIAADVLTAAFLWALLWRIPRAALLALTLWLIAPLLLYSLYTIRMYTLMALWVTMGTYTLSCFVFKPRVWSGVMVGVVCAVGLLTHLYGAFLWGAALIVIVLQILRRRMRVHQALSSFTSLGIALLIFLPFGVPMLQRFLSGRSLGAQAGGVIDPVAMPGQLLAAMLTHRAVMPSVVGGSILVVVLIVGGAWTIWRLTSYGGRSVLRPYAASDKLDRVLPLVIVCGIGIVGTLALAIGSSVYRPRYAVPYVPLLLAVISLVITQISLRAGIVRKVLAGFIVLALVMASWQGLIQNLGRSVYDDWRGAAQFIQTYGREGDVIILIPRWGTKAFEYHNTSGLPVNGLFESITPDSDLEAIAPLIEGAQRVWLVRYQVEGTDPANRAEAWLQERGTLSTEVFPTAIQVKLYDLHPTVETLPQEAVSTDVQFGDVLRLRGYDLPVSSGPAREMRLHPPSNWVQVTLYLEALQSLSDVTLRVRLVDTRGGVWGGALEHATDMLHRNPLASWQTGQTYEIPYDLNLNPDLPPGLYRVEVMLLDASGAPLPTTGANAGANWAFAGEYVVR